MGGFDVKVCVNNPVLYNLLYLEFILTLIENSIKFFCSINHDNFYKSFYFLHIFINDY